jgi:hypothetical protein
VKQEDADWRVYHQIPPNQPMTPGELAEKCGLELPALEDSLARLERYCLVERNGSTVRMLNFGEALIRNQVKYEKDLPFTIENGVIKSKGR